jgi:hypothetical protein
VTNPYVFKDFQFGEEILGWASSSGYIISISNATLPRSSHGAIS